MLLVTGLTGRAGSAFYEVLCRERISERIRVVVRKSTNLDMFLDSPLDLDIVVGDITDTTFLQGAMEGCKTVFHIASKRMIQPLADAIQNAPSVKNVVMVSSTIVYSEHYRLVDSLADDEAICVEKFQHRGIRYIFLRPTMIFGRPDDGNISRFIRWFLKFPVFPIVKGGRATIQPVHRMDLAEGFWLVLNNLDKIDRTEYVISGQRSMTLKEMFQIICRRAGRRVVFVAVPFCLAKAGVIFLYYLSGKRIDYREKMDRLGEDRAYPHDAISEDLGYAPKSFEERVTPLIEELKKI